MVNIVVSAITWGVSYLFGCVGEIISEKAGHLNLGIPGIMCMGAMGGALGASLCSSSSWLVLILMSMLFSMLFSLLGGGIYAFLTVSLRCNQNITGLALTTFGAGFAQVIVDKFSNIETLSKLANASDIISQSLPFASKLGVFGKLFFSYGFYVYLALAIAIVAHIVLKRTRVGLNLRAVGENPAAADAVGINVTAYKYAAILIGCVIAGLGGAAYFLGPVARGGDSNFCLTISAIGWISIALVIFSLWKPLFAIFGSFIFSVLYSLSSYIKVSGSGEELYKMLPYVVTILVLVLTSIKSNKELQAPQALGIPYFREER